VRIASEGNVPYFVRKWVDVPVTGGGLTGTISVMPDYFSIGTDEDFVRMPLDPVTAERIGTMLDARLPTRKMVRDIHCAAPQKLAALPWGPPYDASMMSTQRFFDHNARVQEQFERSDFRLGELTSGHKKDVVVAPNIGDSHVCIYGWFRGPSTTTAIQGPSPNCTSHELTYADYSHGIRFVKNTMQVGGKAMRVADVLKDRSLSRLISDQGVFSDRTTYSEPSKMKPIPAGPSNGKGEPNGHLFTALVFFGLGFLGVRTALT
jgi:hypothetical protein